MHMIHSTASQETYASCHFGLDLMSFTSLHHMNVVFSAILHVGILDLAYLGAHRNKVTIAGDSL